MSELSKQALKVDNSTSFPDNNNGAITPSDLRAFNVNMIDSLVDEITYNADSASWNADISALEAFSSSQQPSFNSLNAFTASASSSILALNQFTQSANGRLNNLEAYTASFTTSVGIYDEGTFVNNVNQIDFNGNGITASFVSGKASVTVDFSKLNSATASLQAQLATIGGQSGSWITESETGSFVSSAITASSLITASFNTGTRNLTFTKGDNTIFNVNIPDATGSTGDFVTTSSFNAYTASTDISITNLNAFTASASGLSTGSLLVTASAVSNVITFTKGNGSTFNVTVADTTNLGPLNQATASLQSFTASANIRLNNLESTTASLLIETSNLETFSASALVSISNLNASSASQQVSINSLNSATSSYVTETESGSFLLTASFDNGTRNLTFTKGNNTTFAVNIPDVSGSAGIDTGSLMVTGSVNGNVLTFTKGDASTFQLTVDTGSGGGTLPSGLLSSSVTNFVDYSASVDTRINNIVSGTGFATTGSNTFYGNQTLVSSSVILQGSGQLQLPNGFSIAGNSGDITQLAASNTIQFITEGAAGPGGTNDIKFINRVSGSKIIFENNQGGQGNGVEFTAGYVSFDVGVRSGSTGKVTFGSNTTSIEALSTPILAQRLQLSGELTASLLQGYAWIGGAGNVSTLVATSSFVINTGSFATTGSNSFTGIQTFVDNTNFSSLVTTSGSLMLVAKGFTSASAHLSSSFTNSVNLIFKSNNNTADTLISGSDNIFPNFSAPTAGFKRYIGGNRNIFTALTGPQISSSMQYSPPMNGNVGPCIFTIRGPVTSSSGWSIANNAVFGNVNIGNSATNHAERLFSLGLSQNVIGGTLNIIANQTQHTQLSNLTQNNINGNVTLALSSSAAVFSGNSINDGAFVLTNQFSSGSLGTGQIPVTANTVGGQANQFIITGSQPTSSAFQAGMLRNLMIGNTNTAFVNSSESRISGTNVYHQLVATSLLGNSLIVTGSSNINDSGSFGSAFVGRFNASDGIKDKSSDVILAVGTGTSITNRKTGFLIDSGSNSFFEGTLTVSGSTTLSGSTFINNLQNGVTSNIVTYDTTTGELRKASLGDITSASFDGGQFWSTITESGSAGVSGSITFNNSGSIAGTSLVNGSQITLSQAGTYNIQFSAQVDTSAGADTIFIWFKKNGVNIADSASKAVLANNTAQIITVNILDTAVANDYYELAYQTTDGHATVLYEPATGNIPAIPSVILTVTQVR